MKVIFRNTNVVFQSTKERVFVTPEITSADYVNVWSQYGYYFSKNTQSQYGRTMKLVKCNVLAGHTYKFKGYTTPQGTSYPFVLSTSNVAKATLEGMTEQNVPLSGGFYHPDITQRPVTSVDPYEATFTSEQNGVCYFFILVREESGWKTNWYLEDITE